MNIFSRQTVKSGLNIKIQTIKLKTNTMSIKSFTDISQSKKLAKILPLESADMGWYYPCNPNSARNQMWLGTKSENADIPCWSLAALLDVLPYKFVDNHYLTLYKEGSKEYCCCCEDVNGNGFGHHFADNPIDACVAMIEKLHELKML